MESLPEALQILIISYTDIKEIFLSLSLINKQFYSTINSQYTLSQILKLQIHTSSSLIIAPSKSIKLIKAIHEQNTLNKLDFVGFATNGGIDGDNSEYSVNNLFNYNHTPYCSNNGTNVDCVAVLKSCITDYEKNEEIKSVIGSIIVENDLIRKFRINRTGNAELMIDEELLFIKLWENQRNLLMNDKETHSLRELERIYDKLKENQNKSLGIRSQNDPNL